MACSRSAASRAAAFSTLHMPASPSSGWAFAHWAASRQYASMSGAGSTPRSRATRAADEAISTRPAAFPSARRHRPSTRSHASRFDTFIAKRQPIKTSLGINPKQLYEYRDLADELTRIATDTDNTLSGGHMHISRTGRQTPARWYWALEALDGTQCEALNMRHMTDTRWCELIHGDYCGKDTAINDTHRHTIEFRTFGPWHHDTAGRLDAAVHYMHAMWRFFQKFPVPKLKTRDIRAMSRVAATQAINDTNATTAGRRRI